MKNFFSPLLLAGFLLWCLPMEAQLMSIENRFTNHTEVGALFGKVEYAINPLSNQVTYGKQTKTNLTIQTFNGIYVTPKLAAGVTLGFDWYNDAIINPISLGARYDLLARYNARIFAIADVGYGFTWFNNDLNGNKLNGGWMINPGIGWRLGRPGNAGFTIAMTYKRQEAILKMPLDRAILKQEESRLYNRLGVRVGIAF